MTAMAHRRPIASHPAFTPLIALWLGALLGLIVLVLPVPVAERGLDAVGLSALLPLTLAGRLIAAAAAAATGALIGGVTARSIRRRGDGDPRPMYAEAEPPFEPTADEATVRRPLRVREELADGFGDDSRVSAPAMAELSDGGNYASQPSGQEGLMILTPQPTHPPRPAPDLDALLDQFDSAFAAFQAGERKRDDAVSPRSHEDPVQAFVAQQTGVPAPSPSPSPMGGLVPDHQAELRAALDKLARSQRGQ